MHKAGAAPKKRKKRPAPKAEPYRHPTADVLLRPDVGTQAQFKKARAARREYSRTLARSPRRDPPLAWMFCIEAETDAFRACEELRPYLRREFRCAL
jgi:hypothetical protein